MPLIASTVFPCGGQEVRVESSIRFHDGTIGLIRTDVSRATFTAREISMRIRSIGFRGLLLAFIAVGFSMNLDQTCGQEKKKNSLASLFNGIPDDLKFKVRDNPVRIDRVEDWLQEHLRGKGKTLEMQTAVKQIYYPKRSEDGTYTVFLTVGYAKANALGDEWDVSLVGASGRARSFSFTRVSAKDAEDFVGSKAVTIKGTVKLIRVVGGSGSGGSSFRGPGGGFSEPSIVVALDDVQINGNRWMPYTEPEPKGPGGAFGGFGGKGKGAGKTKQ